MSYSRKVPGNDNQLSITVVPLKTETSLIPHYQAYTETFCSTSSRQRISYNPKCWDTAKSVTDVM